MRLIRRAVIAGTVVGGLAFAAVAAAPAATAASAGPLPLEYSLDGVTWSATVPGILPADWRPVPGSTATTSLHVRSTRGADARVALYVGAAQSTSGALLEATSVTGRLSTIELDDVDGCRALDTASLAQGESAVFTVTVAVAPSLMTAQETPLRFVLDASMSDPQVDPVGVGCPAAAHPETPAGLAATGGSGALALLFAGGGAALVLLGAAARRRARRSDDVGS